MGLSHSSTESQIEQFKEPSTKDGYQNMLSELQTFLDLGYIFKSRGDVQYYKHYVKRSYNDLKKNVLESDRVRKVIEKLSEGDKVKKEKLFKETEEIYAGMAHHLSDNGARLLGFGVIRIFRAIYKRININEEAILRLRHLMQEHPVILMPSHRSYMDFIIVTYICFHYNLPLPAIAAAMDFKGMKLMGTLLQKAGAFYIRRSFGSDKLYWAVFTEYVHTHLQNGDHPLEFFIEGTRSRTNKSYVPKIGMLSTSLASYFKAHVPDIMIVPVSISFEKNLEEELYAYELLGIPKPKESTKGLLKAAKILSEDYGSVHIHLGDHISVQEFSAGSIDRIFHATKPRDSSTLRPDEKSFVKNLAYHIVKQQQKNFVIGASTLIATVMCQNKRGMFLPELASEVDWLKEQTVKMAAYVDWPEGISTTELIKLKIKLHKNIFTTDDNNFVTIVSSSSSPPSSLPSSYSSSLSSRIGLISQASNQLILSSYKNCLCHLFIEVAMIVLVLKSGLKSLPLVNLEDAYSEYSFLETLLSRDFIFEANKTRQSFDAAVLYLQQHSFISFTNSQQENLQTKSINNSHEHINVTHANNDNEYNDINVTVATENSRTMSTTVSLHNKCCFFSRIFQPFLLAYWFVTSSIKNVLVDSQGLTQKNLALKMQDLALKSINEKETDIYELLSLELINNILSSLLDTNALMKKHRDGVVVIKANQSLIDILATKIGVYVEEDSWRVGEGVTTFMNSKL